ncbi:MAG: HAMP domain-containing protein, partial [Alphaproteobacteria bacterium]|nr:HAMP domain-containing protein [Alphaproteobacteria bacterium]
YALATTTTAALLFFAGYVLLERQLMRGLDQLITSEFSQLQVRLGPDYATLTPAVLDERIHQTADAAPALFFINVDEPRSGMVFFSRNLNHRTIPDIPGTHLYNANMRGIGDVRVEEFILSPFDVTIATPMQQVRATMRSYIEICAGLLLLMLLLSAAIGLGMSRIVLRPLNFIRETAKRISSDNLGERIPMPQHQDELADLTRLLNQMFDRLEYSFNQIKRFAADASHELKTPLSLIRLHAEKLLDDKALSGASMDALVVQLEELARLNQIIDEMLFLSRADAQAIQLNLIKKDPADFIKNFAQDAQVLAEHEGERHFKLVLEGDGSAAYEERWLRQVWLNLLTNALNASPEGGLITMHSRLGHGSWLVVFEDEGPGLPEDQLEQIFNRFTQFGSNEHRARGSGLGLAIARSIVALHGGEIFARNRKDRSGLSVTIMLPEMRAFEVSETKTERRHHHLR